MDLDRIGKFIKELRLKKGLSQNKLSEELHITRQAISNWENGKSLPDSDMLRILSEFFKVSVDDIVKLKELNQEHGVKIYMQYSPEFVPVTYTKYEV